MPEMNCKAIKVPSHSVSMTSVSVLRYSFPRVSTQLCVCGSSSGCLRPRCCDANICCIPLINASSCHSMPLKCTRPLPQSVQHIAAYGDFTVHSQPTANISQFRSENMPSVKKKKADHCCAATYFFLFFFCKNWRNTLINNSNIKKNQPHHQSVFF